MYYVIARIKTCRTFLGHFYLVCRKFLLICINPIFITAGALTSIEVPLRPLLGMLASKATERFEEEAMLTRSDPGNQLYRIIRSDGNSYR